MDTIQFTHEDGIGVIAEREKALNALNSTLLNELAHVLSELMNSGLRALVSRAPETGHSLPERTSARWPASPPKRPKPSRRRSGGARAHRVFPATIAAVKGFALGGGCEVAMACDMILAGPTAVFGQPEVKLGVIPGFGGTQRLVRRVGRQRAIELMMTGRNVKADEAVALGIAMDVVQEGDVVDAAKDLAKRIARNGPSAVRWVKRVVHETEGRDAESGMAAERAHFALCFATADQKEGMAAFLEKRKPEFVGA